jgi:hypothetical protein
LCFPDRFGNNVHIEERRETLLVLGGNDLQKRWCRTQEQEEGKEKKQKRGDYKTRIR